MVIDETELEGLTEDQRDAYIALKEGRNVFLSGNAGTGKSYVLNRFIDDLEARSVPYTINPGDRIAQLLIIPCVHATFIQVDELPESDRGTGGFGSTGAQ